MDGNGSRPCAFTVSSRLLAYFLFLVCSGNKNKTFKPIKSHPKEGKQADLSSHAMSEYAKATLGSGNMRSAVMLPKNEDPNEWLAVNSTYISL